MKNVETIKAGSSTSGKFEVRDDDGTIRALRYDPSTQWYADISVGDKVEIFHRDGLITRVYRLETQN